MVVSGWQQKTRHRYRLAQGAARYRLTFLIK
jgi:hypothetical protein